MDGVRPAPSLRHLRRDLASASWRERHRLVAGGWMVPRPAGLVRGLPEPLRCRHRPDCATRVAVREWIDTDGRYRLELAGSLRTDHQRRELRWRGLRCAG